MLDLRKRVYAMLEQNINWKRNDVVKHFVQHGYKKSTIYRTIRHFEMQQPLEYYRTIGRPIYFDRENLKRLQDVVANRFYVTQRKLARKFGVTHSTIHYNLKKLGIKYSKCQKLPKYSAKKLNQLRKKYRRQMKCESTRSDTFVIVDDKTYFSFSNDKRPRKSGFYSFDREHASNNMTYRTNEKYQKKVLVWLTISSKGISTPFFGSINDPTITTKVYIKKCLKKLLAFIKAHHIQDEYIFWPDLASSHYANETTQWLLQHKISFVSNQVSPQHAVRSRPLEDFWTMLADKVYQGGWKANTELELKRRISSKIKEIDMTIVQHITETLRRKLVEIGEASSFSKE